MTPDFDYAPHLIGDGIALRPFHEDDWAALYAVASDPLIWEVHPRADRWQEPVFRAFFEEAMAAGGGVVVTDLASGVVIGGSRYSGERAGPGEMEIGWSFLSRDYWGGATNRDLKRTMLRHLFRYRDTAIFLVGIGNIRSRRAMEKIGGVEIRRWTDPVNPDVVEHIVYAITKDAFDRGPLSTR